MFFPPDINKVLRVSRDSAVLEPPALFVELTHFHRPNLHSSIADKSVSKRLPFKGNKGTTLDQEKALRIHVGVHFSRWTFKHGLAWVF